MNNISIIIADDHTILRHGIRALLESISDITVVGEAENGKVAIELCQELKPDIVLMDIAMPCLNGIDATRLITRDVPGTKKIILSMHSDKECVHEAISAGAFGYLVKETASNDLIKSIYEVNNGRCYFSPSISKIVLQSYNHHHNIPTNGNISDTDINLSVREREILQLIAEGCTTKQISKKLFISDKTVASHRQNLSIKLDIRDIAGFTRYAIEKRIIHIKQREID